MPTKIKKVLSMRMPKMAGTAVVNDAGEPVVKEATCAECRTVKKL